MSCLCSLRLASLLNSLPLPPPAALLPPFPLQLMAAVNLAAGAPPVMLSAQASATAQAALLARLSLMANLTASARAAMGVNLALPLSAQATASLQATLSAHIGSLNANAGLLNQRLPDLLALLRALANLLHWVGLIGALRAAFGIDLRLPGAVAALQARLSATATATASATVSASAVASLMATMGFAANAQGALKLTAAMRAASRLTLALPRLALHVNVLGLLAALLAALAALLSALRVDLRAPNAMLSLRAAISGLPIAALMNLRLAATATATASAAAAARAAAAASLNLAAAARVNLSAAASASLVMQLTANGSFLMLPPGSCGQPCPLALIGQAASLTPPAALAMMSSLKS